MGDNETMSIEEAGDDLPQQKAEDPTPLTSSSDREKQPDKECLRPIVRAQKIDFEKPYVNIITDVTAKPLSSFLRALGNSECPTLMFDFLQSPFLTARTAGLPYAAALMLGTGNWDQVTEALLAENDQRNKLVAQVVGSLGPVWVKAL